MARPKIPVPSVCKLLLEEKPVLIVSHADGDIGVVYQETGSPLGLSVMGETWWEVHLFPTKEDPAAYAKVLKAYALHCGADPDAARVLSRFTNITEEEFERMTETKAAAKPKTATKTLDERKAAVATSDPKGTTKQAAAKAKAKAKAPKPDADEKKAANLAKLKALNEQKKAERAAAGPKEKKPSAASRFQELIMEGKKSDDDIFTAVKKEFDLDDSKRSYVSWYRNKLLKDGKNPPAAK